jgi:hypothetical protein
VQIIFDALIAAVVGTCHCQPGINAIILVSFVVDEEAKKARVFAPGNHFAV